MPPAPGVPPPHLSFHHIASPARLPQSGADHPSCSNERDLSAYRREESLCVGGFVSSATPYALTKLHPIFTCHELGRHFRSLCGVQCEQRRTGKGSRASYNEGMEVLEGASNTLREQERKFRSRAEKCLNGSLASEVGCRASPVEKIL